MVGEKLAGIGDLMRSSRMLGLVCVEESTGLCTCAPMMKAFLKLINQAGPCILETDDIL